MATAPRQKFKSKSQQDVVVRSAVKEDAAQVLELSKNVASEEIYHMTSSSEINLTLEEEEAWILTELENPNHLILVAEVNSQIVGLLDFSNGHRQRIAHTGYFGMSIEKSLREQGIGTMLLRVLLDWASSHPVIEKVCLNVHGNNPRAIALYKKMGFEVEGVRKQELKYGPTEYVDSIVMAKFVRGARRL